MGTKRKDRSRMRILKRKREHIPPYAKFQLRE